MSAPIKKRAVDEPQEKDDSSDDEFDEMDGAEEDNEEDDMVNEEVQVDFEARNPEDQDFHGIRKLLQQMFLKANINISEMTDTLISQNYVGSVIRQANISDDEEDEEDDPMDTGDDIYGIISVMNMTERKSLGCVQQLRDMLIEKYKQQNAADAARLSTLLQDESNQVGYLINERFINIPAQISLPSFESLWKECERAKKKQMKYDFSHYLMVCKTYRVPSLPHQGKKVEQPLIYTNEEEEFFAEQSELSFSYSVASERDTVVDGGWDDEDCEMDPLRTVLLIPASKMDTIMLKLREVLAQT